MENKVLITYSLLSHLKETKSDRYSNIVELFFPIVKKAIVEFAKERGNNDVKGKNISEIQIKVNEIFGLEIPLSVLDFILTQVYKEISDDNTFSYFKDKGFIINAFVFTGIDEEIELEIQNIKILKNDYEMFCNTHKYESNFEELIKFICSQKLELFATKNKDELDFSLHIPKYILLKFEDERFYKIISDIYLGSLISSYFEYKINTPVSNTELLIDTNFFISLIDLNTYEAYLTCKQLYEICKRLGFRFSILYSTVEQIKVLLNTRLQDFANKEIGLIKESDVFGACIRRNLNKTQLERIKDNIDKQIRDYNIDVIHETRISDLIQKAQKSEKYKEVLQLRNNQQLSALNDTVAYYYVEKKRGKNISEFADVKCWFLNNTFSDYYNVLERKLHERYEIKANDLLALLWLSNPSQVKFDINILSKGGLATYIAKYRQQKTASINTIRDINNRAKQALQDGNLNDKDVYRLSIRMAEGHLTNGEAVELAKQPDTEFINSVKELSKKDEEILVEMEKQTEMIKEQNEKIEKQNIQIERICNQYEDNLYSQAIDKFEREREKFVASQILFRTFKINKISWIYIVFVIIIAFLWLLDYLKFNLLPPFIGATISFLLFFIPFLTKLIDHKTIFKYLKFTFNKNFRSIMLAELTENFENDFNNNNEKPTKESISLIKTKT